MELNELFEKYSIETISAKTKIPQEKLEDLKELNWEAFREPQLIGFLNIIQREYGINIDDIKEEVKAYFREHKTNKAVASIDMVDSEFSSEHKGYYITKFIYILTIAALAYAGWFYYNRETTPEIDKEESNSSVISDTIDSVKNLLGIDADAKPTLVTIKKELNKSEENNNTSIENSANSSNLVKVKPSIENNSSTANEENNNSAEVNKNTQEPKKEKNSDENIENRKFNITEEPNSTVEDKNVAIEDTNVATEDTNSIKKTVDILLEENDSLKNATSEKKEENKTTQIDAGENNQTVSNEEENNKEEIANTQELPQENAKVTLLEKASLISKAKALWVGIYNLDTKKRETKIIKRNKSFDLNLNDGNYAVVTGHNKFNLVTNDGTKTFPKKGKVYLLLSKDEGVKILTRKEYREITKRKAW